APSELDDQFKRVLQFREVVASKKLLYSEFTTIEEWKRRTRRLMEEHLLKLFKSTSEEKNKGQPQSPPTAPSEDAEKDASGQKDKNRASAAKQQVMRVWAAALEAIKQGELLKFSSSESLDKLKIARLGLVIDGLTNR